MSLSRSPWHFREYTVDEMAKILETVFSNYILQGVFGNEKVMNYYTLIVLVIYIPIDN